MTTIRHKRLLPRERSRSHQDDNPRRNKIHRRQTQANQLLSSAVGNLALFVLFR